MKFIFCLLLSIYATACTPSIKNINLTTENSVTLRTQVNDSSVNAIISEIADIDKKLDPGAPIYLILDTPGGSIISGNVLIEFLKGLKREVKTISIRAMSMGFMIQQAAGERLVLASSMLMSHPAATGCQGNVYELRTCLNVLDALYKNLNEIASKRMGMNIDDYIKLIEHDKYFIGQDMFFYNAADRLVTITCSQALMKSKITVETMTFFGAVVKEEYSACPFLQAPLK